MPWSKCFLFLFVIPRRPWPPRHTLGLLIGACVNTPAEHPCVFMTKYATHIQNVAFCPALWNMAPDSDRENHSSTPPVRVFNLLRWRFCLTPDRVPLEKNPVLNILRASFVREEFKSLIVTIWTSPVAIFWGDKSGSGGATSELTPQFCLLDLDNGESLARPRRLYTSWRQPRVFWRARKNPGAAARRRNRAFTQKAGHPPP